MRIQKIEKESPEIIKKQIKGKYLDMDELKELDLNKDLIDEEAYTMAGEYCLLQKIRRGEDISTIT